MLFLKISCPHSRPCIHFFESKQKAEKTGKWNMNSLFSVASQLCCMRLIFLTNNIFPLHGYVCRFLLEALEDLDNSLKKLNSRLFVIRGQPTDVFPRLFKVRIHSSLSRFNTWTTQTPKVPGRTIHIVHMYDFWEQSLETTDYCIHSKWHLCV